MKILAFLLMVISGPAFSAPSHFSVVIGSALRCSDQVSSAYFNDYMSTFFGKPEFTSGGANWWKVSEMLFDSQLEYIFVGVNQDFIGATFKDTPDKLAENIRSSTGLDYKRVDPDKWVASTYSVLIRYNDTTTPSKMYCIGSPYSPSLS